MKLGLTAQEIKKSIESMREIRAGRKQPGGITVFKKRGKKSQDYKEKAEYIRNVAGKAPILP